MVDFLPARASEAYAFSPGGGSLEVLDPSLWPEAATEYRPVEIVGRRMRTDEPSRDELSRDEPVSTDNLSAPTLQRDLEEAQNPEKRVVVIDPGHGGSDPGTTGRGGRREKDIALTIGRYLERELRGDEDLRGVHDA